jgi:hypothetical protein
LRIEGKEEVMRCILAVFIALVSLILRVDASTVKSGTAQLVYRSGTVSVLKAGGKEWKAPTLNSILSAGDHVKTGAGSCAVLLLEDKSTLKMNQNTHILLEKLQPTSDQSVGTKIKLFVGNVWTDVNNFFYGKSSFEVEGGRTSAGVRGTAFDMATTDTETTLREWEGTVRLTAGEDKIDVGEFEEVTVGSGRPDRRSFDVASRGLDDWSGWNNYIDSVVDEHRREWGAGGRFDDIAEEIDSTPDPDHFSAGMGAMMQAVPGSKDKIVERMLRRVPEEKRALMKPQVEQNLMKAWQNLTPAQRKSLETGLMKKARKMRDLQPKWKGSPGKKPEGKGAGSKKKAPEGDAGPHRKVPKGAPGPNKKVPGGDAGPEKKAPEGDEASPKKGPGRDAQPKGKKHWPKKHMPGENVRKEQ